MRNAVLLPLVCGLAWGQSFEVASIKPSPPLDGRGRVSQAIRGPARFTAEGFDLASLVARAYGVERYQISAPDWLSDDRFDIEAKMPERVAKADFQLMLQNLLKERFKMAAHHEQREMQRYELIVAKGGSKMAESAGDRKSVPVDATTPSKPAPGADGFPSLPAGRPRSFTTIDGRTRMGAAQMSTQQLAVRLSREVGRPVTDATGLTGKYDFTLSWAKPRLSVQGADADDPGPDIFGALQQQLGLKLEPKMGLVDVVVVDHIEKLPTAN